MDRVVIQFLDRGHLKPWLLLRYINHILFLWTHDEETHKEVFVRLNDFQLNLKFTREQSQKPMNFLEVLVKVEGEKLCTDYFVKVPSVINTSIIAPAIVETPCCNPKQMERSSFYSQELHLKTLCSDGRRLIFTVKTLRNGL